MDLILKIISTVSTLTIGVAASILAYQQFRLSRAKLRFDLFEKRYAIFMIVRVFASTMAMKGEADAGELMRSTTERFFLFEKDVCDYIETMYKKAWNIRKKKDELTRPNITPEQTEECQNQLYEDTTWFYNQSDEMIPIFSKYLSIKTLNQEPKQKKMLHP